MKGHDYNITIIAMYHLDSSGPLVYRDKVTVAQYGLERSAFNRVVGGSNPPRDTFLYSSAGRAPGC